MLCIADPLYHVRLDYIVERPLSPAATHIPTHMNACLCYITHTAMTMWWLRTRQPLSHGCGRCCFKYFILPSISELFHNILLTVFCASSFDCKFNVPSSRHTFYSEIKYILYSEFDCMGKLGRYIPSEFIQRYGYMYV